MLTPRPSSPPSEWIDPKPETPDVIYTHHSYIDIRGLNVYTMNMNNTPHTTYPRTISFIDSWYWPEEEWDFLLDDEIVVSIKRDYDDELEMSGELKHHESCCTATIDLVSNVMTDDTPLNALAHAFSLAS